jgi:hypothetical protein
MFGNASRYIEFYKQVGIPHEVVSDKLWIEYNRMIVPVGPVSFDYLISEKEAKGLLMCFPKTLLVRATGGFLTKDMPDGWYALIIDKFIELNDNEYRKEIRRGLRNCRVEMVPAEIIAKNGYRVYMSTYNRYKGVRKSDITEQDLYESIIKTSDFNDIINYWGVFYKDELVGYTLAYIYGKSEISLPLAYFNPDFLKYCSSAASEHIINEYYLKFKEYEYINSGFRNILHQTKHQDFLIKKFGYSKANIKLSIFYRQPIKYLLSLTFFMRNFLGCFNRKLGALYKQEEIRRKYLEK